jgi:hypothetical protein
MCGVSLTAAMPTLVCERAQPLRSDELLFLVFARNDDGLPIPDQQRDV